MTTLHRGFTAVATFVLGVALSARASAQTNDAALATELFNAGRDLANRGDCAAAIPKLAQSASLDPRVGTLARLAECEETRHETVSARAHWQQAANLARVQRDSRLAHVEAELTRVDAVVPKVRVTLAAPAPPGLSVRIDGVEVGAASLGVALPVSPGPHTIVVGADGKRGQSIPFETKADGATTPVTVPAFEDEKRSTPVLPPPGAPEGPAVAEAPKSFGWSVPRKLGFGVAAAGVATVGVGVVFGVLAKVKLDQSNADGCVSGASGCAGAGFAERSTAFSDGTIGTVLLVTGGVLAAAGGTLFVLAPPAHEGGDAPRAAAWIAPGSVFLGGSF